MVRLEVCPRCGTGHEIQVRALRRQVDPFDSWAICTVAMEPILLVGGKALLEENWGLGE